MPIPANYAETCDGSDCSNHAYHKIVRLGIMNESKTPTSICCDAKIVHGFCMDCKEHAE